MSTLLNNTPQISIFDIPHILDLICEDLSKNQILACLEVSRTWRAIFLPQALRFVRFSNLKRHQTWTILHSAGLIRSLTIDIADAGWFLDNAIGSSYYAHLRDLHCVDFNYHHKPKPMGHYYTRPPIVDQSQNALRLIEFCPNLRSLTVDHLSRQYRTDHFTEDVFKSIYTHTSLATIKIHLERVPWEFLTVLNKSLPASIKDFELSVKGWIPSIRLNSWSHARNQFYPKDGYPWQQQEQDSMESLTFSGARTLPLERLALGGLYESRRTGWTELSAEGTEPAVVIDNVVPNPESDTTYSSRSAYIGEETVKSFVERSPGLRHLDLKDYHGSWMTLFQLLLENCPDLETVDLSGSERRSGETNTTSNDIYQLTGSFAALREFRISGSMSEAYVKMAWMVVRSAATIEVVWIDRRNRMDPTEAFTVLFHMGKVHWAHCRRLRELIIFQEGGTQLEDFRWHNPLDFTFFEPINDHSAVFGQLEILRLVVKEPLWEECANEHFTSDEHDYWDDYWVEYDDYSHYNEFYGIDFDENDDEDWKPLTAVTPTEREMIRERRHQQWVLSHHHRGFIFHVRELFGRFKGMKKLRELEIEWVVCSSISDMSLEYALDLFRETEFKDNCSNSGYERTSKGWWGEVTQEDLVWLCLPWYPQPAPQPSRVPSKIIKAAAHQYENKTPLSINSNDIPDYNGTFPAWNTGDIYNTRIGRHWKDWADVALDSHPYGDPCPNCHGMSFSCYGRHCYDSYSSYSHSLRPYDVVQCGRDFENFVVGVAGKEESGWGRKMATRGDRGRYRQKAVGKMNQRK
ncbi:MAG: hypothetical protein JOS17DRAFT_773140 [Linnemannia elongata]|nr:MAG: hypothetical protein JOS17DRAFT_773140 [Linnemannia elongata]